MEYNDSITGEIMSLAYAYPKSRYEPAVLVDLNDRAERERLSKSALTGFFKLVASWQVRDEDARELLGGLSSSTYYEWKKNPARVLEVDRITRISYLLGDQWVGMPNTNPVFAGRTPLAHMLAGGLLAMQTVRKLLDARRGGL